ncbi:hypothetical protein L1987_03684 [Smallanthus sonchifolius]|uniref:Uncharacterized protein n=1 Tax=Smallanthus sonchifolius TaxID=185202 RepID=A0ACB9KBE4_9ASTR|nr:hypothetical protein L1987_03684 [Smallanthus sonchifolius]
MESCVARQTNIPPSLKFINASLGSIESRNDQKGCKYAFMVDVDWFANLTDIYEVQNMPSVPAVLDWRLSGNCNAFGPLVSRRNTSVCDSSAFCSNQSVCSCFREYQGNPYLPGGCQGKSLSRLLRIVPGGYVHLLCSLAHHVEVAARAGGRVTGAVQTSMNAQALQQTIVNFTARTLREVTDVLAQMSTYSMEIHA